MFRCAATGIVAKPRIAPMICYSYADGYVHQQKIKSYDPVTRRSTESSVSGSGRQITGQMLVYPSAKALRAAETKGYQPHGGTDAMIERLAASEERKRREEWGETKKGMMADKAKPETSRDGAAPGQGFASTQEN